MELLIGLGLILLYVFIGAFTLGTYDYLEADYLEAQETRSDYFDIIDGFIVLIWPLFLVGTIIKWMYTVGFRIARKVFS